MYKYCFKNPGDPIIFVIDSMDKGRFAEAAEYLEEVISDWTFRQSPVLILANKQDQQREGISSVLQVGEALQVDKLSSLGGHPSGRPIKVSGVSGATGEGLEEALTWLTHLDGAEFVQGKWIKKATLAIPDEKFNSNKINNMNESHPSFKLESLSE